MINYIKKHLIKRPSIQDVLCFTLVPLMKNKSKLFSNILFYFKTKIYGITCNGKVTCYGMPHLVRAPYSEIIFGTNVSMVSNSYRSSAASIHAPVKIQTMSDTSFIEIGDDVGLNGTSIVSRSKKIIIGSGSIIAPNVIIMDSDFHALWPPENRVTNPGLENDKDVIIGKNVWIGTGSIILKGTVIGDNSIVGAGSVVTGTVCANVVVAGNPAKIIKQLV